MTLPHQQTSQNQIIDIIRMSGDAVGIKGVDAIHLLHLKSTGEECRDRADDETS